MDWREILSQLEVRLEQMSQEGVRFLNVPEDAALAETVAALVRAAAPEGGPAAPAHRAARGPADVASRLRGESGAERPPPPPDAKSEPPSSGDLLTPSDLRSLEALADQYRDCMACDLGHTRSRLVFGVGHGRPRILFVGEGPGAEEDQQGLPFVGRAGALLTGLIKALGLTREDVYITNVVKCRPPGNRNPQPNEVASCRPILQRQIELLNPRLIVTLGNVPLKVFKPSAAGITRERGHPFAHGPIKVLPTFHPSYLLRNPAAIETCWKDFKLAFALAYEATNG
jgi:DNA polymerase